MVANRMIAFCDILGFKEMIRSKPLSHAEGALVFLCRLLAKAVFQRPVSDPPPPLDEIRRRADIGFACFSDNVLLYALDDSDDSALRIVEARRTRGRSRLGRCDSLRLGRGAARANCPADRRRGDVVGALRRSAHPPVAGRSNRPDAVAKWRNTKMFHDRACRLFR